MNSTNIRNDFPIFLEKPSLVYLDNAATSQKPSGVIEAVSRFYKRQNANPLRGLMTWPKRLQKSSKSPARLSPASSAQRVPRRSFSPEMPLKALIW